MNGGRDGNAAAQRPLVSVVVPFHNRLGWLEEAIESLSSQTLGDFEAILVDDGSTDDVRALRLTDPRVRLIRQRNQGCAVARNRGLDSASGEFIAFLDGDDRFLPTKLEEQVAALQLRPDAQWCHSSYLRIAEDGSYLERMESGAFAGRVFPRILFACPIHPSTVMVRRAAVQDSHRFAPVYGEDVLLWAQLAKESDLLALQEPLAEARMHGGSAWRDSRSQIIARHNVLEHAITSDKRLSRATRRRLTAEMYGEISILFADKRRDSVTVDVAAHYGKLLGAPYPYFERGDGEQIARYALRALTTWPFSRRAWRVATGYPVRRVSRSIRSVARLVYGRESSREGTRPSNAR